MPATPTKRSRGRPLGRARAELHRLRSSRSRSPLRHHSHAVSRRKSDGNSRSQRTICARSPLPVTPADEMASTRVDTFDVSKQLVRHILLKRRQTSLDREQTKGQPSLTISMQPEKNVRARYVSEGNRAPIRGLFGGPHTYPTVEIVGYTGPAIVDAYLVNSDDLSPHQNILVCSTNTSETCEEVTLPGAVAAIRVNIDASNKMKAVFDNLSIRRLRKVEISKRSIERGDTASNSADQRDPSDHSWACIKFVARLLALGDDGKEVVLTAVSDRLQCVAPQESSEIYLASPSQGSVDGGDLVTLVGKRFKAGFKVRVFTEEPNEPWEEWGAVNKEFSNQGAAVFEMPPFFQQNISEPVAVFIQVKTGREREPLLSDPIKFTYIPRNRFLCKHCNSVSCSSSPQPVFEEDSLPSTLTPPPSVPPFVQAPVPPPTPSHQDDASQSVFSSQAASIMQEAETELHTQASSLPTKISGLPSPPEDCHDVLPTVIQTPTPCQPQAPAIENEFHVLEELLGWSPEVDTGSDLASLLTGQLVSGEIPTTAESAADMINNLVTSASLSPLSSQAQVSASLLPSAVGSVNMRTVPQVTFASSSATLLTNPALPCLAEQVSPKPVVQQTLPSPGFEQDWSIIEDVVRRLKAVLPNDWIKPFAYLVVLAKNKDAHLLKIYHRCQQECRQKALTLDHASLLMQKKLEEILPMLVQTATAAAAN